MLHLAVKLLVLLASGAHLFPTWSVMSTKSNSTVLFIFPPAHCDRYLNVLLFSKHSQAILHSLSLGSASRLHTAAETGAVCALSDASSPCITETQYPHPGHVASHHLASVSTSDTTAPQHHTAHQLCRVALIQRSKITGFRQYATAERPSSRRRATGHVASQSLSPATPTSSLFPTPHEVLESVTSQQEAGSEIDGELGTHSYCVQRLVSQWP